MYSATATGGGNKNQYGSWATTAWASDKTNCSSVYIGLIDSGYMLTHEDLAANVGVNPGEIPNNGKDDDKNGYIDDVHGWNFVNNNNIIFDGNNSAHGTHIAGTIGGQGGNGKGVAGVCWNVKLLSANIFKHDGTKIVFYTSENIIKAVDYFTDLKTRHGLKIVATNNSYGDVVGYSQFIKDAIDRANAANILFVASAGNSNNNNDVNPHYPSGYDCPNIISVASITSTGGLATNSSYGNTTVDLGAPGDRIWSTVPNANGGSGYALYSGTSMATAHVTGASALYAAQYPGATAAQIKAAILAGTTLTMSLAGKVATGPDLDPDCSDSGSDLDSDLDSESGSDSCSESGSDDWGSDDWGSDSSDSVSDSCSDSWLPRIPPRSRRQHNVDGKGTSRMHICTLTAPLAATMATAAFASPSGKVAVIGGVRSTVRITSWRWLMGELEGGWGCSLELTQNPG
ncbi:hypothetical protein ACHAW5_001047 [Stephanodiscus triporus]|uniref:subtilisin n=1 Tax=Stephanodiscus triporus TaxID=2934178 RepID=A0ABD3MHQ7_9STRA